MLSPEHEKLLNFIDDTTPSKVLVSSRVRGVLEGPNSVIVDIGLPTEDEAVEMLVSMAGLPSGTITPEAREIVQFCDCLPLGVPDRPGVPPHSVLYVLTLARRRRVASIGSSKACVHSPCRVRYLVQDIVRNKSSFGTPIT